MIVDIQRHVFSCFLMSEFVPTAYSSTEKQVSNNLKMGVLVPMRDSVDLVFHFMKSKCLDNVLFLRFGESNFLEASFRKVHKKKNHSTNGFRSHHILVLYISKTFFKNEYSSRHLTCISLKDDALSFVLSTRTVLSILGLKILRFFFFYCKFWIFGACSFFRYVCHFFENFFG